MLGKQVVMVFRGNTIGEKIYPKDLAKFVDDHYREKGVELVLKDEVTAIEQTGSNFKVQTRGGQTIEVDGIVAGPGIHPNDELAKSAGLKVDDGIVVNDRLQTSHADIYAAGDVAMFPHAALGKRLRVEHEDNALKSGKQAGRNMAAADEAYTHTPYFYSDLFDLGYEAVGELNSKLTLVEDWQDSFQKGVVYYLEEGRVRGVLLWNVWKKVEEAAALMAEKGPFKAKDLKGKIT
jgi:NADPH-dependent 2,4-dienoyl-CoA reductase/sulfur reductase-like enzyme